MKLNHLAIPYLAALAFMFGGILTNGGIEWYESLVLPEWSIPVGIIALIWAVIYIGAAWSLLILWNNTPHDNLFMWIMGVFSVSTLINIVWSILFFSLHLISASLWCALLLGSLVIILMILISFRSVKATWLLLPYVLWVYFAAYIQYVLSSLNS